MEIREIERHKFIKIIEYALKHESFTVEQICEAVGISQVEFNLAKSSIFHLLGQHDPVPSPHSKLPWYLSTEAFFNYLSFLEYSHAIQSAKRAHILAIVAIFLAAASMLLNFLR